MPIKNLEHVRRLPRQGKIRLGYMIPAKGGKKSYPKESGCFILDPELGSREELIKTFQELYGSQPTSIDIVFPLNNPTLIFPQFYKAYKGKKELALLACKGDGEKALRMKKKGGMEEIACKGEDCDNYILKECRRVASLMVMLPKLPGIGVWQLNTTSRNSIINMNSAIDYVYGFCGRVAMIPLKLQLTHQTTQRIEGDGPKATKHWILGLDTERLRLADLQLAAQTPITQIALQPPDESRDDLLFSGKNGQPVEEGRVVKPPQAKKSEPENKGKPAQKGEQTELEALIESICFGAAKKVILATPADIAEILPNDITVYKAKKALEMVIAIKKEIELADFVKEIGLICG